MYLTDVALQACHGLISNMKCCSKTLIEIHNKQTKHRLSCNAETMKTYLNSITEFGYTFLPGCYIIANELIVSKIPDNRGYTEL